MKAIIYEHDILSTESGYGDDEFEVMEITQYGGVTIWTRDKVWFVTNEAGRIEKLRYVNRHPPGNARSNYRIHRSRRS